MSFNESRFVIIDGVQTEKGRALRLGLIDEKGKLTKQAGEQPTGEPSSTRARSAESTRRKSKAPADVPVGEPVPDDAPLAAE